MFANIFTITKKELKSYYNSPIAYIVISVFLVFMSLWLFTVNHFIARGIADLRIYFMMIPYVFVVFIPAITMRSWAEERKMGTEELLLTLPFKEYELVLGKFLAAFILLVIMFCASFILPISLSVLGDFEWGQIVAQYIGVVLFGGACISVGLFVSSLSRNQIISFIFSALTLFFIIIISEVNRMIELPLVIGNFLNALSFNYHFEAFSRGLIDSRDIVYFILVSGFFLYLNSKVLIFRKWL
jgi:ABC-2 type transport system permease protein